MITATECFSAKEFLAAHPDWKESKGHEICRRSDGLHVYSEMCAWWLVFKGSRTDGFAFWPHAVCYADKYYPLGKTERVGDYDGKRLDGITHYQSMALQHFDFINYEDDCGGVSRVKVRKRAKETKSFFEKRDKKRDVFTDEAPTLEELKADITVVTRATLLFFKMNLSLIVFMVALYVSGFATALMWLW